MRPTPRHPLLLGLAVACTLVLATDGPTQTTPLVWKPTTTLSDYGEKINLAPFANQKVAFLPLVDNRKEKALLGENHEKKYVRFVDTPDAVAPYVSMQLLNLMKESGLPVIDRTEGATIVVSGELLRFNVIEKDTYQGECRAMLEVRSREKLVWKGLALGRASRFGRSYKLENYHEILSDSIVDCVSRLLADQVFVNVLAGKVMVVSVPAAN
jgi:hypothetical protein